MENLSLLIDLHLGGARQGPGSDAMTRRAIGLAGLGAHTGLRIADIGCGTGASTLVLAQELDAEITAVDFLPDFLRALEDRADAAGVRERITTLEASMEALDFRVGSFDAIWSEGAIYNIGFAAGVRRWRDFLKPGGVLAVSELTWLTKERPRDLHEHWVSQYAEVATAAEKMAQLEAAGYAPLGYFPLPESCWLETYYRPLEGRFDDFLARHRGDPAAEAIVEAERAEIALYEQNSAYFSYGFYIARKLPE
ncbi:class I SAM-dependent methyltransferase [Amaricoccus macauensis]|uniref:class I SAM-dependent methyltransferase n=1 Tax=Amaricoccus macauensis TaxID=57001 RepID=UPI003C7B1F8C